MMYDMMTPTTLSDLLSNEDYRTYFKRSPRPFASSTPQYGVVAISHDGRYGKVLRPTFREAWDKAKLLFADDRIRDVSIFTRNRIVPPPIFAADIMRPAEDWCGRCRRPSLFRIYAKSHPALRDLPIVVAGVRRCYYCGISYDCAMQHIKEKVSA